MKLKNKILAGVLACCLICLTFIANRAQASNTYIINGVTVSIDDFSSSQHECWAFAQNYYYKIWGVRFTNRFTESSNLLRELSDEELTLTAEHLKKYITYAPLGSVLRVCNSETLHANSDSWGHSQIIVAKDSAGFTVFEGGLSVEPHKREYYYTWEEFMDTSWLGGQYSYIKYIKCPDTPVYTSYLNACDHYPAHVTATIASDDGAPVWTLPCSSDTDPESENVGTLAAGTQIEALAMYENSNNEYWYKIRYEGEDRYIWCNHTQNPSVILGTASASGGNSTFSTIEKGKSYGVKWLISAEYSELFRVVGVIQYNGWNGNAIINNPYVDLPDRTISYKLGGETIDNGMVFGSLAPGKYLTYIVAHVRNYYWDSASESVKSEEAMQRPVEFEFTVVYSGEHAHDKETFLYYLEEHPHCNVYRCSICGETWVDLESSNVVADCEECRPGKPEFAGLEGPHSASEPVTFIWEEAPRTTHYNIWVYKENASGDYEAVDHTYYVTSGYQLSLEAGQYKAVLQAYNSDVWENDYSDWIHTESDPTCFTVTAPPEEPKYSVRVTDYTKGAASTSLELGAVYAGSTDFTVSCAVACVVAKVSADGYEELFCRMENGVSTFTVNVTEDVDLVIVLRGDTNLDGSVGTKDATFVRKIVAQVSGIESQLSDLALSKLAGDANADGSVGTKDATAIRKVVAQVAGFVLPWKEQ